MAGKGEGGDAALALHREAVRPEWIDYNGHMNLAYYVLVFDHATDALLDHLGLGEDYRRRSGATFFVVEAHVTYRREVGEGDVVAVTTQILDHDAKRLHLFHRMNRADAAAEAVATNELMVMHVDGGTRRAAPLPEDALARVAGEASAHARLERPFEAGRAIAMRRRPAR